MKTRLLFILLSMFMGITMANAQPRRGNMSAEDIAKRQTTQTTEALNLDKATSEKLYQINLKYAEKMKEAFADRSSDRESMRDEMMSIRDQKNKELKQLFTKEQFEKYQKHQQEMMEQRRGMRR
jgi:Ni/Co efflux regulator RcnB